MAAPSVGSVGTHRSGTAAFFDCPVPSGVVAGSLVVVYVFVDGATTITTMPTGFQQAPDSPADIGGGSGNHRMYVMWKRATGADSGNYNFDMSGSNYRAGNCVRYVDVVASGDPWDDTFSAASTTSSTTTIPAEITTTGADRLLCWAATNWSSGDWTPPTGFTKRFGTEDDKVITAADKSQAAAGATGSLTGSSTANDKRTVWLGALKPIPAEVTYKSASNTGNLAFASSRAPAVPAGADEGDVVVVFLDRWESTNPAVTAPAGFTKYATQYTVGSEKLDIFWKRLTAADAGTYSFSWSGSMWSSAQAICLSNVADMSDPIVAINNWSGTAGTYGSLSVSTDYKPGLLWHGYNDTAGTHTPPTNFTEVADADCATTAYRTTGSTGSNTAASGSVSSSSSSLAVLLALAPGGAAAPPVETESVPITYVGAGAWVTGTTSLNPVIPNGCVEDDLLLMFVHHKAGTTPTTPNTPTDWTLESTFAGGTGSIADATGQTRYTVFSRRAPAGITNGTSYNVTIPTGTSIGSMAHIRAYHADPANNRTYELAFGTHNRSTAASSWADAALSAMEIAALDHVALGIGTRDASAISAVGDFKQTGSTFGTLSATPGGTTYSTGGNVSAWGGSIECTAGGGSGAPSFDATIAASESGIAMAVRIRAIAEVVPAEFGTATMTAVAGTSIQGMEILKPSVTMNAVAASSVTAREILRASAILSAVAAFTATGRRTSRAGVANLASVASLSATAIERLRGTTNMNAVAQLTALSIEKQFSSLAMNAVASLTATSRATERGNATLAATATLTAAGLTKAQATTVLSAVDSMTVQAQKKAISAATMSAVDALSLTPLRTVLGTVSMSVLTDLTVEAIRDALSVVDMVAIAELDVEILGSLFGSADLDAIAELIVPEVVALRPSLAELTAVAALQIAARADRIASVVLVATDALSAEGEETGGTLSADLGVVALLNVSVSRKAISSVLLSSSAELVAGITVEKFVTALLETVSTLNSDGSVQGALSVAMHAAANLSSSGVESLYASALLNAISVLSSGTFQEITGQVDIEADSSLASGIVRATPAAATLTALATLLTEGRGDNLGAVSLSVLDTLTTEGITEPRSAANLSSNDLLIVDATLERLAAVNLVTEAVLSSTGGLELTAPLAMLIAQAQLIAEVSVALLQLPLSVRGPIMQRLFRANVGNGNYRSNLVNNLGDGLIKSSGIYHVERE